MFDSPNSSGNTFHSEDEQGRPVIDEEEARAAAREARNFVVQHQSEWSAIDWSALREAPWELNEEEYQAALEEIERLQFRRGLGAKAPQTSRITSYHPLRFLEAIQDQVDAQNVFGDECLPLPSEEQPSGSGRPLLWIGAQSEWVETLQRELNRLGHELVPDGIFGGQTDAAVRDFQTASGCTVACSPSTVTRWSRTTVKTMDSAEGIRASLRFSVTRSG